MTPGQSLSQLTAKILLKFEDHFKNEKPDLVLAHGDTTTSFATAISCFYHQVPFFHVEAGLRTHCFHSPFPEEFNRQSIASIAQHHFAPTEIEKENLIKEGVSISSITVTGSTIHEAVRVMQSKISLANPLSALSLPESRPIVVTTLHRREAAHALEGTLKGLKTAALNRPDAVFVCPVHPNPSVQRAFKSILLNTENIVLTDPLPYPQFISLLLRASLVVTDSGGVQEEAAFLNKPTLLVRSETERRDGLQTGVVKLVGHRAESIHAFILQGLSSSTAAFIPRNANANQVGASEIIADEVMRGLR